MPFQTLIVGRERKRNDGMCWFCGQDIEIAQESASAEFQLPPGIDRRVPTLGRLQLTACFARSRNGGTFDDHRIASRIASRCVDRYS
jgi:hypothetical protein